MIDDFTQITVVKFADSCFRCAAFGADLFNKAFECFIFVSDNLNHIFKNTGRDFFTDSSIIDYFKSQAKDTGIPYQTLINLYLADCVKNNKKPNISWT